MPRIKVDMKVVVGGKYTHDYHRDIQGFIYNLLRGTPYNALHNKPGFKYFTFSNIFPPAKEFNKGEHKSFIIASPLDSFINHLYGTLKNVKDIRLGSLHFKIIGVKKFRLGIDNQYLIHLKTETPVVVRIPRWLYDKYGIDADSRDVFWRPEHGIEVWKEAVYTGLNKKYRDIHGVDMPVKEIFQQISLERTVHFHIETNRARIPILGALFNFWYVDPNRDLRRVIEFMLDSGIGQRTSMGFGFLNPVNNSRPKRRVRGKGADTNRDRNF